MTALHTHMVDEEPRLYFLHFWAVDDAERLGRGLRAALDSLSPGVRDAVLMRVGLDLPYEEVALSLGCSVGAARVRVTRGLHSLAEVMEAGREEHPLCRGRRGEKRAHQRVHRLSGPTPPLLRQSTESGAAR